MWGAWDRKHTFLLAIGLGAYLGVMTVVRYWWLVIPLGIAAYFACTHLTVTFH